MEYIHAALLLHKAGKKVDEPSVKKVLEAAGVAPDDGRVKALIASLEGVNIDEAVQKASVPVAQAAPAGEAKSDGKKEEGKKKEKPAEDEKSEEKAAEGLSSLFG
ncbi:MAG: 50S ribosomal protein P1 [Candidatus Woesearchaeota archaeon]|jgi:large subunit ribosomal protein L12|nr:50S ribosomal protein P1 [Candidatus Woesearchaeota archaeon]MDP7505993.1 50S ribosomal protein P1 [Candidatus Woesearchaeota archaeon]MDP7610456.1 50S ribosomal protein P1 [Candidatus Woesearchaeota archaeon]|tara:strand:+ start:295 stop:609 length:315 start_codon:yes stop_codon:yes gene_type:complete